MKFKDQGHLQIKEGDLVEISSQGRVITGTVISAGFWGWTEGGWYIELENANVAGGYSYYKQEFDGGEVTKINGVSVPSNPARTFDLNYRVKKLPNGNLDIYDNEARKKRSNLSVDRFLQILRNAVETKLEVTPRTFEERLGKSVRETILQALRNEGVNADETSATIDLIAELEQYMDQPMIAELVFDAILKARV
jgi:hypothetical protein